MDNSEERLQAILATLDECRAALVRNGRPETSKLVSLAILDLRIALSRTSDSDLRALCDAIAPEEEVADRSTDPNPPDGQRRAALKLVK